MSNVNADATQLLTILKNMRTSISSIETTRSSVKMKYQQLGIGWNDKKYDELGTIVKDCNKALNDILQIMLQAEKYVASLAKSVQEYDNVNLDTPSARNSFLQGLQTPNVGNSSYQYCLGVLTQGSTPDGYIAVISQRHENAEQNVREVFDHFAGKLMIQDSEYPPDQTAHYSPGNYIWHTREPKIDNEYYEIEEQYFRQFGHGVPREMLPDSISTEQIKQAMKKCILSKKDNLFELLGIIINDNYLY